MLFRMLGLIRRRFCFRLDDQNIVSQFVFKLTSAIIHDGIRYRRLLFRDIDEAVVEVLFPAIAGSLIIDTADATSPR